jgi:hypothetical protein
MGSGKTTVLGEASDVLSERRVVHAILDLDCIGTVLAQDPQAVARLDLPDSTVATRCESRDVGTSRLP